MNEKYVIEYAGYQTPIGETKPTIINCLLDGEAVSVPIDPANRHYAEIMRQVEAGELTIAEAE